MSDSFIDAFKDAAVKKSEQLNREKAAKLKREAEEAAKKAPPPPKDEVDKAKAAQEARDAANRAAEIEEEASGGLLTRDAEGNQQWNQEELAQHEYSEKDRCPHCKLVFLSAGDGTTPWRNEKLINHVYLEHELPGIIKWLNNKKIKKVALTFPYWMALIELLPIEEKEELDYFILGWVFLTVDEYKRILRVKKRLGIEMTAQNLHEKEIARSNSRKDPIVGKWDETDGTGTVFRINRSNRKVADVIQGYTNWRTAAIEKGAVRFVKESETLPGLDTVHEQQVMLITRETRKLYDVKAVEAFIRKQKAEKLQRGKAKRK